MNRRSIRQYDQRMPEEEVITALLTAAQWAPSGLNNQPWKFKVVRDAVKNGLADYTKYKQVIAAAPVAVCVFLDTGNTYNPEKDCMAIGAAIQNMLLVAHERRLGTCWLGEILNRTSEDFFA